MSGGAVVAAAAAARRRRTQRVLDAFRIAGATAPERAQSLESLGLSPTDELTELIDAGVLDRGDRELWYLNEGAYVAHRDARRVRIGRVMVIVLGCAVFVLGALLGVLLRAV